MNALAAVRTVMCFGCAAMLLPSPTIAQAITTAAQAIARSNAVTRLESVSSAPSAVETKLLEDATPFLGLRNTGKNVWRVTYPKTPHSFQRSFVVVIDAQTGHMLFIDSFDDRNKTADVLAMPKTSDATDQLSEEGEKYSDYPDRNPEIRFEKAIETLVATGNTASIKAWQIHAVYVMHSRNSSNAEPRWIVTLNGIPAIAGHGRGGEQVPIAQRNHIRHVVDATTGKLMFSTNSPQRRR